ncbi:cation:proton antiporter [Candidatus Desantisbacteria bacterium CG_4_10_14_0_8_um_filter_48_22]|uniref:Cation:proton antiporter n=1 Tax=Candidatus Desantisbacteria bacterium CG_4_10_14_0_8_um_filter_48_22 TaxID=1974543 RepID=A0A2M7S902_9BACT|nr:MAG: hypothetical protein AUJ67_08415 [Candidatus Desantisbacteria bacterium CG1_02_49_89]PIV57000.1 MAG: cation:proton antiporter [Candidatus Desantisbacteria bacterium CG02_land_8_20_14_3_00_49_13]PIZ15996.1 MAG: cation:proton antiporter [Candidatus Desantisbacteria bacterium CG_4_10_14_0_8_um_filter_48_22]
MNDRSGMTVIVKTVVRISASLILLYGAYIVAYGQLTPGGGFPGGVILGGAFILLCLAFGKETAFRKLSVNAASVLDSAGALIFLGIALSGYAWGVFFLNFLNKGIPFHLWTAGIIPLCNIGIGLKVGAGLFGAFIALTAFRVVKKGD